MTHKKNDIDSPIQLTCLVVRVQSSRQLSHPALVRDPAKRPRAPVVVQAAHLEEVGEEVHPRLYRRETKIVVPAKHDTTRESGKGRPSLSEVTMVGASTAAEDVSLTVQHVWLTCLLHSICTLEW